MPASRPSPSALLNPCVDPIFKILFTDESKESNIALTCFLTDIIGKKVSNVVLQPNELSGETNTDKQSEFDINCKIEGKIVNIEMQGLNKDNHFGRRAEYHVSHLYNHYVTKGLDWKETPQAFQISVLNFIFDNSEQDCISYYLMRNQNGRTIAGMLNVIFMELPKIEPVPDDISLLTPVQMWGKFFLYANKPDKSDFVEKLAEQNRGIKMAVTVLKNISQDEMNWYHETRYWMHVSDEKTMINEAERRGRAEGKKEGKAEGVLEGIKQVAQKAIKAGLPPEQIALLTGLSEEEINQLK
jgi:predicted transposase/invertase (TIGR01784 family)